MLITVQKMNEPRNGKGPWGVQDTTGFWWKLWGNDKAKFKIDVGGTYEVQFKSEQYNGKEQRTISGAEIKAGPSAAVLPAKNNYMNSKNPAESKQIGVLALVKPWLDKLEVGDEEGAVHAVQTMMRVYDRTLAGAQTQRRDDMNDQIPY